LLVVTEVLQINRIVVESTQEKIDAQQTKMKDAQLWVLSTSMQDVVYKESTNELISIKGVEVSKLSVSDLPSFCVVHNISGYKNKK
jgi:galactitol-specific phosphotransferase system IIB component